MMLFKLFEKKNADASSPLYTLHSPPLAPASALHREQRERNPPLAPASIASTKNAGRGNPPHTRTDYRSYEKIT